MIDTQLLKERVNIVDIVQADLGQSEQVSGDWHFWRCPFHDERTASFGVNESTQSWRCFGACCKSGNVIDYVIRYHRMEFKDACNFLEKHAGDLPKSGTAIASRPAKRQVMQPRVEGSAWQVKGNALVSECQTRLHDPRNAEGTAALAWLQQRGLSLETIKKAGLGYAVYRRDNRADWGLPVSENQDKVVILAGVLIPWYEDGILKRLIIRRFPHEAVDGVTSDPYKVLPGSTNILYGGDKIDGSRPVVLVEGVFDALSVQQAAGDLVHVVATGGTSGAQTEESVAILNRPPLVLVAFDNDSAGEQGAQYWLNAFANAKRWRPVLHKDPSEMLEKGANIRKWIEIGLRPRHRR